MIPLKDVDLFTKIYVHSSVSTMENNTFLDSKNLMKIKFPFSHYNNISSFGIKNNLIAIFHNKFNGNENNLLNGINSHLIRVVVITFMIKE